MTTKAQIALGAIHYRNRSRLEEKVVELVDIGIAGSRDVDSDRSGHAS